MQSQTLGGWELHHEEDREDKLLDLDEEADRTRYDVKRPGVDEKFCHMF